MATLSRERKLSKLNISELTIFVDGGDEELSKRRKKLLKEIEENDDPNYKPEDKHLETSEQQVMKFGKRLVDYAKLNRSTNIHPSDRIVMNEIFSYRVDSDLTHSVLFIPTIQLQGNEEQTQKWLPLAKQHRIFGAYAVTELGHGSNVRGLETTATYDASSEEFVVNSPTKTSYKFWPGLMGNFATHAIVLARLITRGVDHGVHPFMVQIRSLEDHTPMPGISLGDIGPKMGLVWYDTGFLCLNNVRIPRDQMLMQYSQVQPDGTYIKVPKTKVLYGTLVQARAGGVIRIAWDLAKAVTIAVRYSAVRQQGRMDDNQGPESQVLDYQTQQLQLFPLLASAYILRQLGYYILTQNDAIEAEIAAGKFDNMQELHASTCGLKAFSTYLCTEGIETCRQACGGHGYSRSSGLPDLYLDSLASMIYEGVNPVLYLQTGRYLQKMASLKKLSSNLPPNVSYLGRDFKRRPCSIRKGEHYMDPAVQLDIYQQRAHRVVMLASRRLLQGLSRGLTFPTAWNESSCDWIAAARAHCYYMALRAFRDSLSCSSLSSENMYMMNCLCAVFTTHGIVTKAGEFLTDDFMTSDQVSLARQQLYDLLKIVRREAVPLVDAFDLSDRVLCSTLGRYDGDVYTALLEWAKKAPRNKDKVHPIYHKHLKKLLSKL